MLQREVMVVDLRISSPVSLCIQNAISEMCSFSITPAHTITLTYRRHGALEPQQHQLTAHPHGSRCCMVDVNTGPNQAYTAAFIPSRVAVI